MLNTDKIIEIFFIAHEFCNEFDKTISGYVSDSFTKGLSKTVSYHRFAELQRKAGMISSTKKIQKGEVNVTA